MKKNLLYITALMFGAIALQSCDDNWVNPPMDVPHFPEGVEANTTIAELKTKYWQASDNYGTQIGLNENGDSIYIQGTVASSDKSGNIYKSLILQDESGAITIGINQADLYEEYPMGFGVAVNVTGLTIGRYNGLVQLGKLEGTGVNRIELADFAPHAFIDLEAGELDTITTTIADIKGFKSDEDKIKWQSRLVRLDSVRFVEAGQPFTNGSTTSRNVTDKDGNRLTVYNSSYSDFAYDKLPRGYGSVVGILSAYKTTWQLLLIDAESCFDFSGEGSDGGDGNTPVGGELVLLADGDTGWTYNITNNPDNIEYVWKWDGSRGYLKASAYVNSANHATEAWAISPVIDLSSASAPVMAFEHALNYLRGGDIKDNCNVYVRAEGATDWVDVTVPVWPAGTGWDFENSKKIDITAYAGKKIQVGFKFNSTAENSTTWEIKNLTIYAAGTPDDPGTPDTPVDPETPVVPEGVYLGATDANGLNGWTIENVSVPEGLTNAIWTWKSYNNAYYLNGSAYGGTGNAESWVISPVIDVKGEMTASFEHAAKFQTCLKTACGVAIREEGATAWTMLTIPTWPEAGAWTFVNSGNIDLSAYADKKVQIGFKYGSNETGADTWEIKNLTIVPVTK